MQWTAAANATTPAQASGGGLEVGNPATPYATWLYNSTANAWVSNIAIIATGGANVNGALSGATTGTFSGLVTAANIKGEGSAISNITGANVIGNVASATIANTVTNPAQPNITSVGTLTSVSVSGTATMAHIAGEGGNISNITGANVIGNVASATIANTVTNPAQPNITSVGSLTSVSVVGNATVGNLTTAGLVSATGNVTGANLVTAGLVSATGNVTGNYILGNGALLSGLSAGYSNATAAAFLASGNSTPISVTGNITGNTIIGNGAGLSSLVGANVTGQVANALIAGTVTANAQSNITSVGTLTSLSVSGLVTAANIKGEGSAISNITGANVTGQVANALVAGTVYVAAQPAITSVGSLTSVSVVGNAAVGNLTTAGLVSATGNVTGGNLTTAGLVSATGNVTGGNFIGDGSFLTNITGANVTGNVPSATIANTVTNPAQPNITSVGTLTSLSVTGNVTGAYFLGNGALLTGFPSPNVISNGSSNVAITTSGGSITGYVGGVSAINISSQRLSIGTGAGTGGASYSVAVGYNAGAGAGQNAVAIGQVAGNTTQGQYAVAVGAAAGYTTQGLAAIAIGYQSGNNTQGANAIAIGANAAYSGQGAAAIAIGDHAALASQGTGAIAIGSNSVANAQTANSIVINATGLAITASNTGFYVNPVRNDLANVANAVYYNVATNEFTYAPPSGGGGGSYGNSNVSAYLASGTDTANIITTGNIAIGTTIAALPNTVAAFGGNVDNYLQVNLQNLSGGSNAEAQYVVTADNGSDTVNYLSMGVINSGYDTATPTNSLGNIIYPADMYVYAQGNISNTSANGGNLALGTTVSGKAVKIFAGGNTASNIVATITSTGISVTGNVTASIFKGANTGFYANPVRNDTANTTNVMYFNTSTNEVTYGPASPVVPQTVISGNVTLSLPQLGTFLYSTATTATQVTIPSNANVAFPVGSTITVVLQGTGSILLQPQASVNLYLGGNTINTTRTISPYGISTLLKVGTDTWFINGTGVY